MQRAPLIKLFVLFLLGVCSSVQASNVMPYIISSQAFYQSEPDQLPLSEQMSAVINSPPSPIRTTQLSPVRVAVLFSNSSQNILNKAMLRTFEARMQALGIAYQVMTYDKLFRGGVNDPFAAIRRDKPDYLIATKLDIVQSRIVERVLKSGEAKVIYFNLSTPLENWKYHPPLMYVGFNQAKVVDALASYIDRQLPKNTHISALTLPSGYMNDVRCNGFLDAMAEHHRHVDYIQSVADNKEAAFRAAQRILKKTPKAFIFSCSQAISEGVVEAIKQQRNKLQREQQQNETQHREVSNQKEVPSQNNTKVRGQQAKAESIAQTNSWGLSPNELTDLTHHYVLVSSLFMWDDLAIAIAEGIKGNMEGRTEPTLYVGRTSIMSPEQGLVSLHLMLGQAYRYSKVLQ